MIINISYLILVTAALTYSQWSNAGDTKNSNTGESKQSTQTQNPDNERKSVTGGAAKGGVIGALGGAALGHPLKGAKVGAGIGAGSRVLHNHKAKKQAQSKDVKDPKSNNSHMNEKKASEQHQAG